MGITDLKHALEAFGKAIWKYLRSLAGVGADRDSSVNVSDSGIVIKGSNNVIILNRFHMDSTLENGVRIDPESGRVDVNPATADPEVGHSWENLMRAYFEEHGRVLEFETSALLGRLYEYRPSRTDGEILDFFRGKIPDTDLGALEASLYLRSEFFKEHTTSRLKESIRSHYGDRGKNISNHCTAGYFEEFLRPLAKTDTALFEKIYEDVVGRGILAVFVHKNMKVGDIRREIMTKTGISRKYGVEFIHIHGIGKRNRETIERCIEDNPEFFGQFKIKRRMVQHRNIIMVELFSKT